ncbi:unnamed protein product [Gadus morhua 'NCC']
MEAGDYDYEPVGVGGFEDRPASRSTPAPRSGQGYERRNKLELRERHGVRDHGVPETGPGRGTVRTPVRPHATTHGGGGGGTSHGNNIQRLRPPNPQHATHSQPDPQALLDSPVPGESMTDRAVFSLHTPPDGGNLPPFFQSRAETPSARAAEDPLSADADVVQRPALPPYPQEGPWSGPPVFQPAPGNQSPWVHHPMPEARQPSERLESTLRSPSAGQNAPDSDYPDEYETGYEDADMEEGEEEEEEEEEELVRVQEGMEDREGAYQRRGSDVGPGGRDGVHDGKAPVVEGEGGGLWSSHAQNEAPPLATDFDQHLHLETTVESITTEAPRETTPPTTTIPTTTTTIPTTTIPTTITTTAATTTTATTTNTPTTSTSATTTPTTTPATTTTTTTTTVQPGTTNTPTAVTSEGHRGRTQPQAPFDPPGEDLRLSSELTDGSGIGSPSLPQEVRIKGLLISGPPSQMNHDHLGPEGRR